MSLRSLAALAALAVLAPAALAQPLGPDGVPLRTTPAAGEHVAGPLGTFAFLDSPNYVAQLADGRVLVTSSVIGTVQAYQADGTPQGAFASGLAFPIGVAELTSGAVLVSESWAGRVLRFSPAGVLLGTFANGFDNPNGVLQLDDGRVLVSDFGAGEVRAFRGNGTPLGTFTSAPTQPTAILQLDDGRVVVVDGPNDRAWAFTPDGTLLGTFATLSNASRGCVLLDGTVLLTSALDNRVRQFAADGTDLGLFTGALDGPAGCAAVSGDRVLLNAFVGDTVEAFEAPAAPPPPPPPPPPVGVDLELTGLEWSRRGTAYKLSGALENGDPAPALVTLVLEVYAPSGQLAVERVRYGSLGPDEETAPRKLFEFSLDRGVLEVGTYEGTVTVLRRPDGETLDEEAFTFTVPPDAEGATAASLRAAPASGPNPFRASTTLRYRLEAPGPVDLRVFDAAGREVAVLEASTQPAGDHAAVFEAGALPAGVYVWRLEADGRVTTGRLSLVR